MRQTSPEKVKDLWLRQYILLLTGLFLIQAAWFGNSQLAGGLQNAFQLLAVQPWGAIWLGMIGIGFICYGLYMFAGTIHRRYTVR